MNEREQLEQAIDHMESQRPLLGDAVVDAALAPLREKLDALKQATGPAEQEGERRVVTALFCDVARSTELAEQLDPEEWTNIMNAAFDRLTEPVLRYKGTVARLMGDAILALFGAPTAHEDDPQRAVLAGLAILGNIQPLRRRLGEEFGLDFNVRIGINTGLAVVGRVGSQVGEYTAMGDGVNLAARMEQTAKPGTVQIAENTYRLVAPLFEVEALGGIEVKGKAEPVNSYRVVRPKATRGPLRGIEGLAAPLIGRAGELETLTAAVDDLENGLGRIVCLIGEAGLGKSRLLRELKQAILPLTGNGENSRRDGDWLTWYQTESLSYETERPYALIQRLIRRMVGVTRGDSAGLLRNKIGALLELFPPGKQEDVRLVFESLFGLESQSGQPPLVGEAFKGRLFTVMSAYWRRRTNQGPVILVCDDLHWSDPASAALLRHLFPLTESGPLLILCAMRPDEQSAGPDAQSAGWGLKQTAESDFGQRYLEVQLRALNADDSNRLVDSLLAISDLPARLRARILDKTEGNPFFVEEVVRALIESGAVARDESGSRWLAAGEGENIEIPGNVLALLTARIDRLEEDARSTLQLASVVGRSFYYRVLARIVEAIEDLEVQLLSLGRAQLIQEASRLPELEYIFRHALTQEAAYSTILLRQRRLFHRRVGESLESLFPEQRDEIAGSLARHFFLAEDYQRALDYYTTAGDIAFRLYALVEAIDFYSRAIDCAAKVNLSESERLIHLFLRRGRAYEFASRFEEALDNYLQLAELARESDDEALLLASLIAQCIVQATPTSVYDLPAAGELGQAALKLARKRSDRASEARALWGMMLVEFHAGEDLQKVLAYGEEVVSTARELGLEELMAYALANLAYAHLTLEHFEAALAANRQARSLWRALNNLPMLADSLSIRMGIGRFSGQLNGLVALGEEGLRLSQSIGNSWHENNAYSLIGYVHAFQGRLGLALENMERANAIAEKSGIPMLNLGSNWNLLFVYYLGGAFEKAEIVTDRLYAGKDEIASVFSIAFFANAASLKIAVGKLGEAQAILEGAFADFNRADSFSFARAPLFVADGQLQLALGKPEKALDRLEELLQQLGRTGSRFQLAEALWLKGLALRALNRPEEAREALLAARSSAEETEERPVLWRVLVTLAELEELAGNAAQAGTLRAQALEIVDFMADHAGVEELRASFLSLPEVQSLLATIERSPKP